MQPITTLTEAERAVVVKRARNYPPKRGRVWIALPRSRSLGLTDRAVERLRKDPECLPCG